MNSTCYMQSVGVLKQNTSGCLACLGLSYKWRSSNKYGGIRDITVYFNFDVHNLPLHYMPHFLKGQLEPTQLGCITTAKARAEPLAQMSTPSRGVLVFSQWYGNSMLTL